LSAARVVGIVGGSSQVRESLSPAIHNAAFEALDLDWVYVPFPVESGRLEDAVKGLVASGVAGFNVTMPHKLGVAQMATRLEGPASRIGAVNTVMVLDGALVGYNTDAEGLRRFLQRDVGFEVVGRSVVVIGAGGAARSSVAALSDDGAARITVLARNPTAAAELAPVAGDIPFDALSFSDGEGSVASAALIVNATPVGQQQEELPVVPGAISSGSLVVDLVYHPAVTPLMKTARERGAAAFGGLGMLVHQAALGFQIWTGRKPPMAVMSAAAMAGAGRAGSSLKGANRPAD
jgi:shikimate dehydrogenase